MSDCNPSINYDALDNYITGHYGEDQYPDEREPDPADNIPEIVSVCEELNCDSCYEASCKHNRNNLPCMGIPCDECYGQGCEHSR